MLLHVTVESGGGQGFCSVVASTICDGETPPIIPHRIRPRHHHPVLCVVLDVSHSGGDVLVPECERVDAVFEEVALIVESAVCPLLRLHGTDHNKLEQKLTCDGTDHDMLEQNLAC